MIPGGSCPTLSRTKTLSSFLLTVVPWTACQPRLRAKARIGTWLFGRCSWNEVGNLRRRSVAPSSRANPVNTTASLARRGPMQRNGVTHFLRGQLRLRLILVKSGIQLLTLLLHLNFKQQADPPRQGLRSADEQSFGE